MNKDLEKYIGYIYKFDLTNLPNNGKSYTNCLQLAKQFYKDHGYKQTFDDGKPWLTDKKAYYIPRIIRYLKSNFKEVNSIEDLEYGDIICLTPGGRIAVYLGNNEILTIEKNFYENKSKSLIYSKGEWEKDFKFGFKRNI